MIPRSRKALPAVRRVARPLRHVLFLLAAGLIGLCSTALSAKGKALSWKTIDDALLRINDVPVKDWSVYQATKKRDPLLLQIGNRFLLVQLHDKQVFEVNPAKLDRKTDEILWDPSEHASKPLATSEWSQMDTGTAFMIDAKLNAENRALHLELPHQLDFEDVPEHPVTRRR